MVRFTLNPEPNLFFNVGTIHFLVHLRGALAQSEQSRCGEACLAACKSST